ncbi:MAG: transcriptional regulator [Puniceicoccaceae bacterium]|nr:MAG: transcriptional regulator [Puniceicoccaceae bacterium]
MEDSGFNDLIHQPVRLRLMALLNALDAGVRVDFTTLRDRLGLTEGNLGAHLLQLEKAGYLKLEKTFVRRRPKTWVHLTARGARAFESHVEALRSVLDPGGS